MSPHNFKHSNILTWVTWLWVSKFSKILKTTLRLVTNCDHKKKKFCLRQSTLSSNIWSNQNTSMNNGSIESLNDSKPLHSHKTNDSSTQTFGLCQVQYGYWPLLVWSRVPLQNISNLMISQEIYIAFKLESSVSPKKYYVQNISRNMQTSNRTFRPT